MIEVKNKERLEKLKELLASLTPNSNLCLVYDIDADGMSSGVLLKHTFERLGLGFKLELTDVTRKAVFSEGNQQKMRNAGIDWVVVADISIPGFNLLETYRKLMQEGIRFIFFDHHEYEPSMQTDSSLLIHPKDVYGTDKTGFCTSKLIYDLLNNFVDISSYDWVKCIGMIGDMAFLDYPEEVRAIINKYEKKEAPISSNADYYTARLGRISRLIDLARAIRAPSSLTDMFTAYSSAPDVASLENKLETMDVADVKGQIDYYAENFKHLLRTDRNIYFLEITSPYMIGSVVSSIVSQSQPDHTFIIYEKTPDAHYAVNARRQDKNYSMRDLMSLSVRGLPDAHGGGHVPAAGGSVRVEDWEKLKNNILKYHEQCKVK